MKNFFMNGLFIPNQTNENIVGTIFKPNQKVSGGVSSYAPKQDADGIVIAPIVNALITMLSFNVSIAITNCQKSQDNPTFYIEVEDFDGNLCSLIYDSDSNEITYEWDGQPEVITGGSTTPIGMYLIIPRLVELLYFCDNEFLSYYEKVKEQFDLVSKGVLNDINCIELVKICDLLFKQAQANVYDIDVDNVKKTQTICLETTENGGPIELVRDISTCMGHTGNFVRLSFANGMTSQSKVSDTKSFDFGKEKEIPEKYKEPAYFPRIPTNVVVFDYISDYAQYIYETRNDKQPINNISLFGPTGSGKSFICKYWASKLCFNLPYITVVCSGNKDESIFTGMYQNGENGNTIFVNSKFADVIQMPCVIELVEMNSLDEDVIIALNSFMDHDYGYLVTDNFEPIKRHPNCIVVSTFNPGYAGTKTPNRSVIRRSDIMKRISTVPKEELKQMIRVLSDVDDDIIINMVFRVYECIEKEIMDQDLDGEVSMTEYANCARVLALSKRLNRWNPIVIVEDTIINKLMSTINFDMEITNNLLTSIKQKLNLYNI